MTTQENTQQTAPGKRFQSGVRATAGHGLRHAVRRWWALRGVGSAGDGIVVDTNVKFLRHTANLRIGDRALFKEGARLCVAQPDAHIYIGRNTTIGYHTFLFASAGIEVGDNCLIAPFCYVVDANHGFARGTNINTQDMTASPIHIGNDVWLGVQCIVLAGVRIGSGAVVGAGSLVNADVPENAIMAGTPARIQGYRE